MLSTIILTFFFTFGFAANPLVEETFSQDDSQDSYQRSYVINVANKAEDCYFIPEIRKSQVFNFHFVVVNAGRAGQQLDISTKIRSPSGKLVQYINRRVEDQLIGYRVQEEGDYEICFNNRYSMLETKRIFWQFEVEGAFDEEKAKAKLVNATVDVYNEASVQVQGIMRKVNFCTVFFTGWTLDSVSSHLLLRATSMEPKSAKSVKKL